ncbi:MAG: hypothetical protein Q7S45_00795 [Candidatus Curtissbacteria bacterium]|nr:hypothetical protein [Candidatus Curtissbacteria bacterium]
MAERNSAGAASNGQGPDGHRNEFRIDGDTIHVRRIPLSGHPISMAGTIGEFSEPMQERIRLHQSALAQRQDLVG